MALLQLAMLLLAASASALHLGPRLSPACRFTARSPAISLCDPLLVGGIPVGTGDAVLCKDQESQAWWRATIRETKGSQVLVHYMGCDDDWDEWIDAGSPNILAVDAQESTRSAFQSEEEELALEGMDDEAVLDAYRQQKWDNNARWQLSTFAQSQLGEWAGTMVSYEPSATSDGSVRMVEAGSYATSGSAAVLKDGEIEWRDTLHDQALATSRTLRASSFDRERGTNCVGNAYTFTAGSGADGEGVGPDGNLMFELGLRDAQQRVRVKFAYSPASEGGMGIERVAVVRERETSMPALASAPLPPGAGLYDPPPGDRANYVSLYCDGGITLVFPVQMQADAPGFVSVDWTAGSMRYQLDRKFERLQQRVGTLELTEISREDAEVFPPRFKDSGKAGQD